MHPVAEEDLKVARERFLESKASYTLRNDVVDSVMMVNPIIKAVHRGTDASPIERYASQDVLVSFLYLQSVLTGGKRPGEQGLVGTH